MPRGIFQRSLFYTKKNNLQAFNLRTRNSSLLFLLPPFTLTLLTVCSSRRESKKMIMHVHKYAGFKWDSTEEEIRLLKLSQSKQMRVAYGLIQFDDDKVSRKMSF